MSHRTAILTILDGFGVNPNTEFNAIAQAKTPNWDRLLETYSHEVLDASEGNVGLPKGFMGNSEVGHLNIGAGRVVYQDFSLISRAIEDGSFFENPVLMELISNLKLQRKGALHLIGLVSDGGVHSHQSHLFSLLQLAKRESLEDVYIHAITDGRDTSPTSGLGFVQKLESYVDDLGVGKIASVMGRFYAMDRDKRWERTEKAYSAMVCCDAEAQFDKASRYLAQQYDDKNTDEFLPPAVLKGYPGMQEGDAFFVFNFRADRARQLTRALSEKEFVDFARPVFPALSACATMTCYDETLSVPNAFDRPVLKNTLGEVIASRGWPQLRIAETEKYAHVTYFFNGGEEKPFSGEKRVLIPSPREVATYDLKPEMSAAELTSRLLKELDQENYGLVVVNFANPDMVGHTGNLKAAIKAVETVDRCLGKIVDWIETNSALGVITADHGNCEMMQDGNGMPLTAHTLLRVPFVVVDPKRKRGVKLRDKGKLSDIAPTVLKLWDIAPPKEMTGRALF